MRQRLKTGAPLVAFVLLLVFVAFPMLDKAFADPGLYRPDRRMSTYTLPTPTHGYLHHGGIPAVYLSAKGVDRARHEAMAGASALAAMLCNEVPGGKRAKYACGLVVAMHFYRLKRVLDTANARNQCVRALVFSAVLIKLDRVRCTRG